MRRLKVTRSQTINSLKCDRFMADAAFDVVESQTQTEDMFKHFRKKKIKASRCCRRFRQSTTTVREAYDNQQGSTELEESMENKAEAIQMLLKAQKKTYWEHFDRGLMSKEALHQLIEWADSASDHKGKVL
ncbi:sperm-specific sodium:proton exchanger-like [Babylonia areolata]|uniref:sperm-specific sodium:proton exchanger-like n=1 Tax=Babylonia areolata TaxID=304850 RepID=UPI003FCFE604